MAASEINVADTYKCVLVSMAEDPSRNVFIHIPIRYFFGEAGPTIQPGLYLLVRPSRFKRISSSPGRIFHPQRGPREHVNLISRLNFFTRAVAVAPTNTVAGPSRVETSLPTFVTLSALTSPIQGIAITPNFTGPEGLTNSFEELTR